NPALHCRAGHWLLDTFGPFKPAAELVRYHHVPWDDGQGARHNGRQVPMGSHILHLADRLAILISEQKLVLPHVRKIRERIDALDGKQFHPSLVQALHQAARRESFWMDASCRSILTVMRSRVVMDDILLEDAELLQLAEFFRRLIDFRSPFTACHSSGVAAAAETLAKLSGFSPEDTVRMRVASYLHDLGKLAIPREVLEKPAPLSADEFAIMEGHVYYTYRILESIADLRTIREWSAFHQERLDGSGYPFHLKSDDLSTGARILAVADVFTALTEDRPYREGMTPPDAIKVLEEMSGRRELDPDIVQLLGKNLDGINSERVVAQTNSHREYERFMAALN
ncbi:MAG: HD domain-containing protein, partial [Candidatus Hydrogenedentes bacterium]|nr:HD domain-containing protein [Candidatus Hydrogenedentota bacterium]